jgi:hypothetical protein
VGKENLERCGPMYKISSWRIKIIKEMCNKFKSPDIVTVIKVSDLNGLGML